MERQLVAEQREQILVDGISIGQEKAIQYLDLFFSLTLREMIHVNKITDLLISGITGKEVDTLITISPPTPQNESLDKYL
jgi:hypothetical protein